MKLWWDSFHQRSLEHVLQPFPFTGLENFSWYGSASLRSVSLSKTLTTIHFNQEDQNAAHILCVTMRKRVCGCVYAGIFQSIKCWMLKHHLGFKVYFELLMNFEYSFKKIGVMNWYLVDLCLFSSCSGVWRQ